MQLRKYDSPNEFSRLNIDQANRIRALIKRWQSAGQGKKEVTWESSFELFLKFKEEYGDGALWSERTNDKYQQLRAWKSEEKVRFQKFIEKPESLPEEDQEKCAKLLAAGFQVVYYEFITKKRKQTTN